MYGEYEMNTLFEAVLIGFSLYVIIIVRYNTVILRQFIPLHIAKKKRIKNEADIEGRRNITPCTLV